MDISTGLAYCANDDALYRTNLTDFYQDSLKRMPYVDALSDSDIAHYRIEVHALKSVAQSIGATSLSMMALALERAATSKDVTYIYAHEEELMAAWQQVMREIVAYVGEENLEQATQMDVTCGKVSATEYCDILGKIRDCLIHYATDEALAYMKELLTHECEGEQRNELTQLYQLVDDFEYEMALAQIEKMLGLAKEPLEPAIGVFDSGVGGISVLRELVKLMPSENFIYYGDSAHAPYGSKSLAEVEKLTVATADYLVGEGVKALVVACNTATAAAVGILRQRYRQIPVIGIEPAIKPAVKHCPGGLVVVLATEVTLHEDKFIHLLEQHKKDADIRLVACPDIVTYVEAGDTNSGELAAYLKDRLESALSDGETMEHIDAVVLGCTHYPFVRPLLATLLSDGCYIIDGGEGTARETKRRLTEARLLTQQIGPGTVSIRNSDEGKIPLAERLYHS